MGQNAQTHDVREENRDAAALQDRAYGLVCDEAVGHH